VKDVILEAMGVRTDENKLLWVKQLINWQKEITDSKEFLEAVKFDAFHHRNFIFSPMGDVYDLPDGSTPVDLPTQSILIWVVTLKVPERMVRWSRLITN